MAMWRCSFIKINRWANHGFLWMTSVLAFAEYSYGVRVNKASGFFK